MKRQSQISAEHALDRRGEESSEEKSGKEGKLERNEHVLVVTLLFVFICPQSMCCFSLSELRQLFVAFWKSTF
jgi:hypothetical protein